MEPEAVRMLDELTRRSAALAPAQLRARVRAAGQEFLAVMDGVTDAVIQTRPPDGGWTLALIADHVAQSTVRAAEELRHLLAGRRPPGPPVYEGLLSGAAPRLPGDTLRADLRSALDELDRVLAAAPDAPPTAAGPTAPAVLMAPRVGPGGEPAGEIVFVAELDWRAYGLIQRLHILDHRTQARQVRAALGV